MSVDMKIVNETMENLKKRQFRPFYVEKKEDVLPLLKTMVAEGETVANGGSVTLGHAMGRNNYLFCQNEMSAERTCKIYSIIESCKLCKIDPYKYMCEILSRKPEVGESWSDMLPSNIKFA